MARSYAKLLSSIWRDPDFTALDDQDQRLYLLLISQPDVSAAGVLPIRFTKWARMASNTDPDDIETRFGRLIDARFIIADWDTEEALIRSFIRHDGGANHPNFHKAIKTAIQNIESSSLQASAGAELNNAARHKPSECHPDGIETSFEPHPDGNATPIASSQHLQPSPAASSREHVSPELSTGDEHDPAAAAIELLITHRLATQRIDSPTAYANKVRRDTWREHGPALRQGAPDGTSDPARWLAAHVLGVPGLNGTTAEYYTPPANVREQKLASVKDYVEQAKETDA